VSARHRLQVELEDASIDVMVDGLGPLVVLLPSSLRDSTDFDFLATLLADRGYRVLRPQPRGMGQSSPPSPQMTLDTLANDVAGVIRHFAAGPAVVVGHAFGHWVARVLDWRHPACVRGVVMLGAAAREFPPGVAEQLAIASDTALPDHVRLTALQACMFAPGNDPSSWLSGWYPQWRTAYQQAGRTPPKDQWYGQAHSPVLDLQGAQDVWRPRQTRMDMVQLLGDKVQVYEIQQAGHALVPEQPEAVANAILAWMAQLTV